MNNTINISLIKANIDINVLEKNHLVAIGIQPLILKMDWNKTKIDNEKWLLI